MTINRQARIEANLERFRSEQTDKELVAQVKWLENEVKRLKGNLAALQGGPLIDDLGPYRNISTYQF